MVRVSDMLEREGPTYVDVFHDWKQAYDSIDTILDLPDDQWGEIKTDGVKEWWALPVTYGLRPATYALMKYVEPLGPKILGEIASASITLSVHLDTALMKLTNLLDYHRWSRL